MGYLSGNLAVLSHTARCALQRACCLGSQRRELLVGFAFPEESEGNWKGRDGGRKKLSFVGYSLKLLLDHQ